MNNIKKLCARYLNTSLLLGACVCVPLLVTSCSSFTGHVVTNVKLDQQVKIANNGLHFDGENLDFSNFKEPDSGEKYDYFFGRNISAHGDAIKTYKHYVFMTWYKGGKDERNVMLSRYNTKTGTVKTITFPHKHTGFRGNPLVGESHNTIGIAVSPINGTIHMVYDMHAYDDNNHNGKFKDDYFRYSYSVPGAAELKDSEFTLDKFVKDTSEVSQGVGDYKHLTMTGNLADRDNFAKLTYPKFFTNTDGTLLLYMRLGGNNNGAYVFNRYDAQTQKWSTFTDFNFNNQTLKGNAYNWGLYGNMKYVNGKLRVGFQQRSGDNNDKYKYQNGVYYAYSDHAEGVGSWKNHRGEAMTWPLVNSDEIKVFEPGDYITHTEPNSVFIVGSFDWTVTAKGDVHFISKVRSTDTHRADYQEVYLHSYKPAGAAEFITSTDFTGASNIYTSGDNIYIIGLKNGYPYVEKAEGGTNNFERIYEQNSGLQYDHGVVHIANDKLYYYLMERGSGSSLPLHLQIIDLGIVN
ncbi:BNR-4 repeat-containing protein [Psychrosphaera sp. 1_MG-2023]|uniref:BNR-4 repeat-containing protein n=1 Tax=Psychrosphaera sp. 1_MG-2023 TaxID=3062643 RepID=UPI0026E141DE|nr:BNR-4 repeat-containing protein [Psychrosphaera sp. 1_MG-2023]MDO6719828.1 BNR-4 repeat-containing protein [Psychrosphaera sp. 1_MG-2023]